MWMPLCTPVTGEGLRARYPGPRRKQTGGQLRLRRCAEVCRRRDQFLGGQVTRTAGRPDAPARGIRRVFASARACLWNSVFRLKPWLNSGALYWRLAGQQGSTAEIRLPLGAAAFLRTFTSASRRRSEPFCHASVAPLEPPHRPLVDVRSSENPGSAYRSGGGTGGDDRIGVPPPGVAGAKAGFLRESRARLRLSLACLVSN
jgi:hypothetical protein